MGTEMETEMETGMETEMAIVTAITTAMTMGGDKDNASSYDDHETEPRPSSDDESLEFVGEKRSLTVTIATVYTTVTTARKPEQSPSPKQRDYHKVTAIDW